jgi:transcriptional regulator with XRE-family HTH domain
MQSETESIQTTFLNQVKQSLKPNISFVDDLAELLNISRDSAYRRIRGETVLSLDEVKKICSHYGVSLDTLLSPNSETVSFNNRKIDSIHFTFEMWLKSILSNMEMICSFPEKELWYAAKDIPLFQYYAFPRLAAFKMFFWMKTYHRYPQYEEVKFSYDLIPKELIHMGKRIWDRYAEIPSVEIWSDETSVVTQRQIEYYHETGVINTAQAHELCDEYSKMLEHIQLCARNGAKENSGSFSLYKNDILIAETTIFFKMGDKRVTFLTYNTMNVLTTSNERFCKNMEDFLTNVINKSIQISTSGEKERARFFNRMQDSIQLLKKKIS